MLDLSLRELYFFPVTHELMINAIRSTGKIDFRDTMTDFF
jgi:hypothetical protein